MDTVNDGVFVFDQDHRILYINHAFSQLTGFSVSQAINRCWHQLQVRNALFHNNRKAPQQAPGDDEAVQRLQHNVHLGQPATEELDMSTAYGHTLRCQLSVSPLASDSTPGGAPTTYVGVLVDSAARRGRSGVAGSQLAMDGTLAGAEDLLSNAEVGLLVTDPNHPDNIIIYANAGFEKLTGTTDGIRHLHHHHRHTRCVAYTISRICRTLSRISGRIIAFLCTQTRSAVAPPQIVQQSPHLKPASTGYSSAEAIGRNCRFLQGPETDLNTLTAMRDAIAGARPVIVELINYRKDGSKFWNQARARWLVVNHVLQLPVLHTPCLHRQQSIHQPINQPPNDHQVSLTPMKDQHGAVVNYVGVLQDTSDRKAVEAAFQLRDLSRPSALSSLSEGISIADPNLNDCPIVYVNDAFCRMTGYAREDVLHKNCRFLQGPDTDPAAVDALRRGIKMGKEVSVELLNYRKDGQRFWNLLTVMPVHDREGRVTSLVGVQNDITELVRAQRDNVDDDWVIITMIIIVVAGFQWFLLKRYECEVHALMDGAC